MNILIYFIIGIIVAFINNLLYGKLQSEEEKISENPAMILALLGWILFWPVGLINTVGMCCELIRRKKYENK